jgi:hypothetical protein
MTDHLDTDTRARVSADGGVGRAAKLSPQRRAEIARAAAKERFAPRRLAEGIVRAWPDLDDEERAEVLDVLVAGLPVTARGSSGQPSRSAR